MKRSFRVATVFTGAAAAAALAPAAAAYAAPVAPGATAGIAPDITGGNCFTGAPFTSSTVLYYAASENHATGACFASKGTYTLGTGKRFQWYCAGQYSGHLWIDGSKRAFTEGYHRLFNASVSKISISKVDTGQHSGCGVTNAQLP
jgi:hypothetical protein